ncbi:MAG: YraN family protein [Reichenbachiella sp.]|uniref:YraN family protein n=1 Tax=Reichenbachiella sp. TaxID=2184521 RepID=UPI0032652687
MNSKEQGKSGEDYALKHLLSLGYDLIERNYRYRRSEIDLIMWFNVTLVFVEVKWRSNSKYGFPEHFVSANQQKMIMEGAEHYILESKHNGPIRFDIVAINAQEKLVHFKDAFH